MSLAEEAGKFVNSGNSIPYEHAIALWNEFVLLKKDMFRLADLLKSDRNPSKNVLGAISIVRNYEVEEKSKNVFVALFSRVDVTVTEEQIENWTEEQRQQACRWAASKAFPFPNIAGPDKPDFI